MENIAAQLIAKQRTEKGGATMEWRQEARIIIQAAIDELASDATSTRFASAETKDQSAA